MAKTITITGETPFQVEAHSFAVSPSTSGYILMVSADGTNWSEDRSVPANDTAVVVNIARGMFFYLADNTASVTIVY